MRTKFIIIGIGLLCLLLSRGAEAELYNDGGVHNVVDGSYDQIDVDNPPPPLPAYTTVNVGTGGIVSSLATFNDGRATLNSGGEIVTWQSHDNSRATMNDGSVNSLSAYDNSQVVVNGGITIGLLRSYNNSQMTVNAGYYFDDIYWLGAYDNSRMTIGGVSSVHHGEAGGNSYVTIDHATFDYLYAFGNSQVNVDAAYVRWSLPVHDDSQVAIDGGIFGDCWAEENGRLTVTGGHFERWVSASDNGRVTFVGSGFMAYDAYDPTKVFSGYGDLTSVMNDCLLWGTLANGDRLQGVSVGAWNDAHIFLVPAPGAALLGVLGLSYTGWRLRRGTC